MPTLRNKWVTYTITFEEDWERETNEVESTWKSDIRKADFLSVGEACKSMF